MSEIVENINGLQLDMPNSEQEGEELTTPEERIDWLRSKGIQIDLPGEKRTKSSIGGKDLRIVKVVRIPCDESKKMEELELQVEKAVYGDQLLQTLKPWFQAKGASSFNMDMLKETAAKQFGNSGIKISEDILQSMAEYGSVEAFTLDQPVAANGYQGVAFYLDEASQLKSLPPNKRATQIARECGFIDVPLSGDIYLGRTVILDKNGNNIKNESNLNQSKLTNIDFNLADVSSSGWMKGAESRNYAAKAAVGQIDMTGTNTQESTGSDRWDDNGVKWSETKSTMDITFSLKAWAEARRLTGEETNSLPLTIAQFKQQCKVLFTHNSVKILSKASPVTTFLDIMLCKGIETHECTYTLTAGAGGGCEVEISLGKASSGLWNKLYI